MEKRAHAIGEMLRRIEREVRGYPKAALFELASRGHASVFEQLVACILSIRTRDEVTLAVALRLFSAARTPGEVAALSRREVDSLIRPVSFHERKAGQIQALAARAAEEHGGRLPCDSSVLRSFPGVGPKCANLVLGIACGEPCIAVDVHVQRVTNRWGYVRARTPEATLRQLEERVPERYRIDLNRLLVPFGKHICTRVRPRCLTCPILVYCRQVGVTDHR